MYSSACLRRRSPLFQLGDLGSAVSSRVGSGAEPQPKSILVTFSGNSFNDFPENQLLKFHPLPSRLYVN